MYSNNLELHWLGSNWDWHAVCWDGHAVCWDWHAVFWEGHAVFSVAEWDWHAVYSTCSRLSEIDLQFAEIDICSLLRLLCSFLRLTCSLLRLVKMTHIQFAEVDNDIQFTLCCSLLRLTCYLYAVCQDWFYLLYMHLADIDILFTLHAVGWDWHAVYSTSWFTLHIHMLFTPHDIDMQITV